MGNDLPIETVTFALPMFGNNSLRTELEKLEKGEDVSEVILRGTVYYTDTCPGFIYLSSDHAVKPLPPDDTTLASVNVGLQ